MNAETTTPGNTSARFPRREALKFLVASTATASAAAFGFNPFRAWAALAREKPTSQTNPESEITHEASKEVLMNLYEEVITNTEFIDQWSWEILAKRLQLFANLSYPKEKIHDESFDEYFHRFVLAMHQECKRQDMSFDLYVAIMRISADNIGSKAGHAQDRIIGAKQLIGGGLLVDTGLENYFVTLLSEDTVRRYNNMRSTQIPTIGWADMETEAVAHAYLATASQEIRNAFKKKHPIIYKTWENTLKQREVVEEKRIAFEQAVRELIKKHKHALFYLTTRWKEIGLADEFNDYQFAEYTQSWSRSLSESLQGDKRQRAVQQTRSALWREIFTNYEDGLFLLFKDQALNPNFWKTIESLGQEHEFESDVTIVLEKYDSFDKEAKILRGEQEKIAATQARVENNSSFQVSTTIATMKWLFEQAGFSNTPEIISDTRKATEALFKTCSIREIAEPEILIENAPFAKDKRIDPVYEHKGMLTKLNSIIELIQSTFDLSGENSENIYEVVLRLTSLIDGSSHLPSHLSSTIDDFLQTHQFTFEQRKVLKKAFYNAYVRAVEITFPIIADQLYEAVKKHFDDPPTTYTYHKLVIFIAMRAGDKKSAIKMAKQLFTIEFSDLPEKVWSRGAIEMYGKVLLHFDKKQFDIFFKKQLEADTTYLEKLTLVELSLASGDEKRVYSTINTFLANEEENQEYFYYTLYYTLLFFESDNYGRSGIERVLQRLVSETRLTFSNKQEIRSRALKMYDEINEESSSEESTGEMTTDQAPSLKQKILDTLISAAQ